MQKIIKLFPKNPLVLIIFLAFIVRFYNIYDNPPALNWDEASHGYNAYSILKTGKDEWGEKFPLIFRAYGDYKLPVYIYLTALSEFFFGLNAFSVRLLSVLAGLASVLFTFLLARRLMRGNPGAGAVGLLAALLVAVEPWSLFLSRGAFEANLALAFIISGAYFFLAGLEKAKYFFVSMLLFGLSVWTYNSARVFVPLLLINLILLYKRELAKIWKDKKILIAYFLFPIAFFFLPMFWQLLNPSGQARYGWVAILDEGAVNEINEARAKSELPGDISRLVYNKATYFSYRFANNWINHFSPNFLFLKGGNHFQFNVSDHGLIYPLNAVFFFLGLFAILKSRRKEYWFLLVWLLLAPIPSSITREAPHALRSVTMLPIPMIITALGVVLFWESLKELRRFFLPVYLVAFFLFLGNYLTLYFGSYKTDYSWVWQYGYKEAVAFSKDNYDKYDKIIVSKKYGEPHEFFLFFWPWDPGKYQNDPNLIRFYQSNWYWVDRFDKFYFVNDWQVVRDRDRVRELVLESGGEVDCNTTACLLITSPDNYPEGWKLLKTINFLNGKPAFQILENDILPRLKV